jgi:hypothetical protein
VQQLRASGSRLFASFRYPSNLSLCQYVIIVGGFAHRGRLYELEQVTEARNAIRRDYEELRRQRLEAFMAGFGVISLKLKEMYQMITLGGDAELELLDSLDPFSEGIVFR